MSPDYNFPQCILTVLSTSSSNPVSLMNMLDNTIS